MLLFLVLIFFVGGGWLIGKAVASFVSEEKDSRPITFTTNVTEHHTHNHLHIDKKTLKEISRKK